MRPTPAFVARLESAIRQAMAVFHEQGKSIGATQAASANAGPVSVGSFIAPIAGKTLSRGGTVLAELQREWPAIAGAALAGYATPEKLTKGAPEPGFAGKTPPSVLHLKVDPAKALEAQYCTPQIIERVNQTLGFRAVSGLRIVQAPVAGAARPPRAPRPAPVKADPPKPENRLSAALTRMANGVKERGLAG
jgi:hypothetical protein